MSQDATSHKALEAYLGRLAQDSLSLWGYGPSASARLWSHSENAIYIIDDGVHEKTILRINRLRYNSPNAIACELTWLSALRQEANVTTPTAIPGRDGAVVQEGALGDNDIPRNMVLFELMEGQEPDESQDLIGPFERLGEVAAHIHNHSQRWRRPQSFERLVWSCENILGGPEALWGDWRAAPSMDREALKVLERQEAVVRERLAAFGAPQHRWGLIHGDLRLSNLLLRDGGEPRVIDFDDCGLGWYMHDFATALSFIEDHPQKSELTASWLTGYRRHRALPAEDETEIPTFIALRRMQLLAWIGSHSQTELAKEHGAEFTRVSCALAEEYLSRFA